MKKWQSNPIHRNQVLEGEGFYISYNPSTNDNTKETALYDGKVWRILDGDFRKQYEAAFSGGLEECVKVYDKYKAEFQSDWSTD